VEKKLQSRIRTAGRINDFANSKGFRRRAAGGCDVATIAIPDSLL